MTPTLLSYYLSLRQAPLINLSDVGQMKPVRQTRRGGRSVNVASMKWCRSLQRDCRIRCVPLCSGTVGVIAQGTCCACGLKGKPLMTPVATRDLRKERVQRVLLIPTMSNLRPCGRWFVPTTENFSKLVQPLFITHLQAHLSTPARPCRL